jgi:hypothetical protein
MDTQAPNGPQEITDAAPRTPARAEAGDRPRPHTFRRKIDCGGGTTDVKDRGILVRGTRGHNNHRPLR